MPNRGRRLLAGLTSLLGSCLLASGCVSLPQLPLLGRRAQPETVQPASPTWRERITTTFHHAPAASSNVLQPQSVVYWAAGPSTGQGAQGYRGRSTVGPDGNITLGPYKSVHVAGLTAEQARAAIIKQVAYESRDAHPRVVVSLTPPAQEGAMVAHHPTTLPGGTVQRTGHTAGGPTLTDNNENRLVPSPNPALNASPNDIPPSLVETPAGSPELPFPRTMPNYPMWNNHAPHAGGPGLPGLGGRAPNEMFKALAPAYIIEPPDILLIEYGGKLLPGKQPIRGQHLVFADGTVHLGAYGSVRVAGLTLDAARQAIADVLRPGDTEFDPKALNVDLLAINSKVYYVITDGAGYGEQVRRFPFTGNETVLDAISLIEGLPPVSSKKHIWVARRNPMGSFDNMLPVDWVGITQRGAWGSNYQLMPGDRLYVQSDHWRRFDTNVQKVLSPFERILGATLLGASTVQEIRLRQGGTGGTGGGVP